MLNSSDVDGSYASSSDVSNLHALEVRRVISACRAPVLRGAVSRLDALGEAWAPAFVQSQASDVFYYPLDQLVVGLCSLSS